MLPFFVTKLSKNKTKDKLDMKIRLAKENTFWGLYDFLNYDKILVWLNDNEPEVELDYDNLPEWQKAQIKNSIIGNYIVANPNPIQKELKKGKKPIKKKNIKRKTKKKQKTYE